MYSNLYSNRRYLLTLGRTTTTQLPKPNENDLLRANTQISNGSADCCCCFATSLAALYFYVIRLLYLSRALEGNRNCLLGKRPWWQGGRPLSWLDKYDDDNECALFLFSTTIVIVFARERGSCQKVRESVSLPPHGNPTLSPTYHTDAPDIFFAVKQEGRTTTSRIARTRAKTSR